MTTTRAPHDQATAALIEQTRSAVLNVILAAAAGIAASGLLLRVGAGGATTMNLKEARLGFFVWVVIVFLSSLYLRRWFASRSALRDPATRAARYFRAHVAGAALGGLAVPLGLAFGLLVDPRLEGVAPFWVAAMAAGFLSYPRSAAELRDFPEPLPIVSEPPR